MPSAQQLVYNIARAHLKEGKDKKSFMSACEKIFDKAENEWLTEGI